MYLSKLLFIIFIVFLFSCKQNVSSNQIISKTTFENKSIEKKYGCENEDDTTKCLEIKLSYPFAKNGEQLFDKNFNSIIDSILVNQIKNFNENTDSTNINKSTLNDELDKFTNNYIDFAKNPDGNMYKRWEMEIDIAVVYENDSIITINCNVYSFTGGAHPNTYLQIITIEKPTGKIIPSKTFFIDNQLTTNWLEDEFRKDKSLDKSVDLEQEGYFLKNGKFFLPDNIGFEKDSILFYYNDYEIASHAEGPTALKLPISKVESQLNPIIKSKVIH